MKTGFTGAPHGRASIFIAALLVVGAGLTACGTSTAAAASATSTPNCTRGRPAVAFTSITGTITGVSSSANSVQVTSASGQVTSLQLTTTTRITKIVTATAESLTPGTTIQVTPDTSGSSAMRIVIAPSGTGGFGLGNGGAARGTPPAGVNPACLATRTPRLGGGQGTQGTQGQQAIRGTVTSASSAHVVLTDTSGETLAFAITPSTVILSSASGSASDLTSGSKVTVTGTLSGSVLTARTIVLQPPTAA